MASHHVLVVKSHYSTHNQKIRTREQLDSEAVLKMIFLQFRGLSDNMVKNVSDFIEGLVKTPRTPLSHPRRQNMGTPHSNRNCYHTNALLVQKYYKNICHIATSAELLCHKCQQQARGQQQTTASNTPDASNKSSEHEANVHDAVIAANILASKDTKRTHTATQIYSLTENGG